MTATGSDDVGRRHVDRPRLQEGLHEAEERTLAELTVVREALSDAVRMVMTGDGALGERVAQEARDLHQRYDDVHERLVTLIARQAPVAGDLRLATALLHVNDRLERMSAQCVNIVTLCRAFPRNQWPSAGQLECLSGMATLAEEQMAEAARVFAERDVDGARQLSEHDLGINEHNRRCFALAVRDGDNEARRELAFLVALMARAIERIGDNAVDIGRQAAFVASGRLERTSHSAP
jgi:phosphate transport system protein